MSFLQIKPDFKQLFNMPKFLIIPPESTDTMSNVAQYTLSSKYKLAKSKFVTKAFVEYETLTANIHITPIISEMF